MKMSKETYQELKTVIDNLMLKDTALRQDYRNGDFANSDKVKDLDKRFRFDVWWYIKKQNPALANMVANEDLNDDHLYTALKKTIPPLVEKLDSEKTFDTV